MGLLYPSDASSAVRAPNEDNEFARDVYRGLTAPQKVLAAKYLYDEVGSALFEAITLLPEYGLTRAEERLLLAHADDIAERLARVETVAELGSGGGRKTQPILEAITRRQQKVDYFAIDVSSAALQICKEHLRDVKGVRAYTLQNSYLEGLAKVCQVRPHHGPMLLLFLGSTIGNFSISEIETFLKRVRASLRPGDGFLLGADLVKSPDQLLNAYDDPAGVTAAFNKNLLSRINLELDGDFRLNRFRHEARWRADEQRIEMHLVSLERQSVTVAGANCRASFHQDESIWTESSQKFKLSALQHMARQAAFIPAAHWIDQEWPFAESLWIAE